MTIRHLRIFIEVVDSGKMSTAASRLFISQPTVSQAIKELEEHYGGLLFERLSRKLYITEKGQRLLSYARNVVKQFDDMEEMMIQDSHVKKIKIGATNTVGNCILGDVINAFKEINPQTEIYSYVNNTKNIEEKLLRSELDIAIIEGRVKSPDLISIPELNDFLVLICSARHPFAKKKIVKLEDLKNESLAVISIRLVEEEIKNGTIHVIQNTDHDWDRFFSIVYHKNKVVTDEMKDLIEVVKDYKHVDILQGINTGELKE